MNPLVVFGEELALRHDFAKGVFPFSDLFDFDHFGIGDEINPSRDGEGFHFAAEFFVHPQLDRVFWAFAGLELEPVGAVAPGMDFGEPFAQSAGGDFEVFADLAFAGGFALEVHHFEVEVEPTAGADEVTAFEHFDQGVGLDACGDHAGFHAIGDEVDHRIFGEFYSCFWFPARDALNPPLNSHLRKF